MNPTVLNLKQTNVFCHKNRTKTKQLFLNYIKIKNLTVLNKKTIFFFIKFELKQQLFINFVLITFIDYISYTNWESLK